MKLSTAYPPANYTGETDRPMEIHEISDHMNSEEFSIVYRAARKQVCLERALVLKALGIDYEIRDTVDGCELVVPISCETEAKEQIRLYDAENTPPLQGTRQLVLKGDGAAGVMGYFLVLLIVFYLQHTLAFDVDWLDAGRMDVEQVHKGEWWRTFTALMLHVDVGHLISNIFFGSFFGIFLGQYLGSGTAWAIILIAGACGNALNTLIQTAHHRAIGASTAVFAALGILSAFGCIHGWVAIGSWPRRWASVIGGIVLLAFIGTGSVRTDVTAHLAGFVVGLAFGFVLGKFYSYLPSQQYVQMFIGVATLAWIVWIWRIAASTVGE